MFHSSDETIYGPKLMRLIIDGGTEALRKVFQRIHSGNLQLKNIITGKTHLYRILSCINGDCLLFFWKIHCRYLVLPVIMKTN